MHLRTLRAGHRGSCAGAGRSTRSMFRPNCEVRFLDRARVAYGRSCGLMAEDAVPTSALLAVIAAALDRALEEPWTKQQRVIERTKILYSVISSGELQDNPDLLVRRLRQEIDRWERQDNSNQLRARMEQNEWEDLDQ